MSTSFFAALDKRVSASNSLLCIGLDPHVAQLPAPGDVSAALAFCLAIVAKTHTHAAAFKPNCAFFEAFGAAGVDALRQVIAAIPGDIPVILDCKRGDIDTTAQAYAAAAYDILSARGEAGCPSAVTLSPYMGWDSIRPFVTGSHADKGAFVLCKTSNPSSKDIQDRTLGGGQQTVYESVATLCLEWNNLAAAASDGSSSSSSGSGNIGLVAGATDVAALRRVRAAAPQVWILCPGVGAQGGEPPLVCPAGLRIDGSGLLVSVSRAISGSADPAAAARKLQDEVNACRGSFLADQAAAAAGPSPPAVLEGYQSDFILLALSKRVLQFGSFTLKSGRVSPYFFNAGLFSCGHSMHLLSRHYASAIRASGVDFEVIFGPAYKGIPLAACIAAAWFDLYGESKDYCYNRKEAKDHGEGGTTVGAPMAGRRVLVVDDVITAGTAIRESVDILTANKGALPIFSSPLSLFLSLYIYIYIFLSFLNLSFLFPPLSFRSSARLPPALPHSHARWRGGVHGSARKGLG